ncbi:hypothetical protein SEVIR_3G203450v4 [Setaria viridis]
MQFSHKNRTLRQQVPRRRMTPSKSNHSGIQNAIHNRSNEKHKRKKNNRESRGFPAAAGTHQSAAAQSVRPAGQNEPPSPASPGREPGRNPTKTPAENPPTPQPFLPDATRKSRGGGGGGGGAPQTRGWVCRKPTRARPSGLAPSPPPPWIKLLGRDNCTAGRGPARFHGISWWGGSGGQLFTGAAQRRGAGHGL